MPKVFPLGEGGGRRRQELATLIFSPKREDSEYEVGGQTQTKIATLSNYPTGFFHISAAFGLSYYSNTGTSINVFVSPEHNLTQKIGLYGCGIQFFRHSSIHSSSTQLLV